LRDNGVHGVEKLFVRLDDPSLLLPLSPPLKLPLRLLLREPKSTSEIVGEWDREVCDSSGGLGSPQNVKTRKSCTSPGADAEDAVEEDGP
jgi:hypothetical protein